VTSIGATDSALQPKVLVQIRARFSFSVANPGQRPEHWAFKWRALQRHLDLDPNSTTFHSRQSMTTTNGMC